MTECLIPVTEYSRSAGNDRWAPSITVQFRNGDCTIGLIVSHDEVRPIPEGLLLQAEVVEDAAPQVKCRTRGGIVFCVERRAVVAWKF